MHVDEYNDVYHDRINIAVENRTSPYYASRQIDWKLETAHANIHNVISSKSSEEDEDEKFFEQAPPQDNREFMKMIWKGIQKTYKLVKGLRKKKSPTPSIRTAQSESAGTSKRGRRS